jgi:Ca2+-binding RTX toxin-like protein
LDSFTYKANDGSADSGVVTVKLNVAATPPAPNTAPTAVADTYNLKQNAALSVSAALGVLANDSDANGDSLKAITVAGPAHGSVVLKNDGSFVYTPVQGFTGLDSFTYKANDGAADSGVVAVKLNVAPIVVAPPADPLAGDNTIVGTSLADILEGRGGNDTISGLGGSDYLNGGIGNDKLNGGIGNDKLTGDSGNDVLIAGDGNDVITGGIGKDFITSGLGADQMFFVSLEEMGTSSSSRDVITDFDPRFDRINLFNIDADTSLSGNQAFSLLLTAGADFTKAGQLHFEYTTVSGVEHTIIEGNVNRRVGADFQIDLVGHIKVAADDFML